MQRGIQVVINQIPMNFLGKKKFLKVFVQNERAGNAKKIQAIFFLSNLAV